MRRALAFAVALVAVAGVFAASSTGAENVKLFATVGPDFTIALRDANGGRVTQLPVGTYDITVEDLSNEHNFHLQGPGVNRSTDVAFVGTQTWTVTITDGSYRFYCDPHATVMRGTFIGGSGPTPPPPPPPAKKLTGTVGPGYTISLRTPAGVAVRSLRAGRYAITVRDRGAIHNFHLTGTGLNRRTGVAGRITTVWTLQLRAGTLRWVCDPHRLRMRGSARVT
jgi:plastocyanin